MVSFFEHQDRARRNTRLLLGLMLGAVLCMGLALYALLLLFKLHFAATVERAATLPLLEPRLLMYCLGGTAVVVAMGSTLRTVSMPRTGRSVAELLGGRLVSSAPRNELETRLVHVVEEMAIASGVPVPLVFVLEGERGINAFAAGYALDDAAIAVTRGALEQLTREELQGVIAHEFSHVLNGDMRMNMQLMGVVAGIVYVATIGRLLMEIRPGSRTRGKGNALALLGVGLFLIGLIGEFFGTLIKAAVSRQREFLADASAVQFTRNPAGLAGALAKIAACHAGSRVNSSRAAEASHLFFGEIGGFSWLGLLATHPPIEERMRRLDSAAARAVHEPRSIRGDASVGFPGVAGVAARAADAPAPSLAAQVGTLSESSIARSKWLLTGLPEPLREAAHVPYSACAIVYALLLSAEPRARAQQCERLAALTNSAFRAATLRAWESVRLLPPHDRLPLVELLAPALRELSAAQRGLFVRSVQMLIECDAQVSIFEYVVAQTVRRRLVSESRRGRPPLRHTSLKALKGELELLLSLLSRAGHADPSEAAVAFEKAHACLGELGLRLLPAERPMLSALAPALEKLEGLTPALQAAVVDACGVAVLSDHAVNEDELTLVRAVCDAFGCPVPAALEAAA